jgi:signal transduction histidine kinase
MYLVYLGLFSAAAAGCLGASWRVSRRIAGDVERGLVSLFVSSGLWAGLTVAQLLASTAALKAWLFTVGLVVGFGTVGCWLYFASAYTGQSFHRNPTVRRLALGGFLLVSAVKLTNPLHGRYFSYVLVTEPFPHLVLTRHAPHWVVTVVAYALALVGFVLLVRMYLQSGHSTGRVTVLAGVTAVPIIPDVISVLRPDLLLGLTYEPIGVAVFAVGSMLVVETDGERIATPGRAQLVDELQEPVVVVDAADVVRDANPAAIDLFERTEHRLAVGRESPAVLSRADSETDGSEPVAIRLGDDTRQFLLRSTPVSLGPHQLGRTVVLTDVTTLERQRRTLRRQRREMDNIAEAVTHELRNDLNIAVGYAAIVDDRIDDGVATDALDSVVSAHRRMADVVDDLTTLALLTQSTDGQSSQRFADVVDRAHRQRSDGLDVTVETTGTVVAERARLIGVLSNLLRHAADRGATSVTAGLTPDGFVLRHDGEPVPADRRAGAFEHGSSDVEGIGLANAAAFARVHGWSLSLSTDGTTAQLVADGVETAFDGTTGQRTDEAVEEPPNRRRPRDRSDEATANTADERRPRGGRDDDEPLTGAL